MVSGDKKVADRGVKKSLKFKTKKFGSVPIIGIGASAGGLKAIEQFFSNMPSSENGASFVLVQHRGPDNKSVLTDLIKGYTEMDVLDVTDGMVVRPNTIYITPPKKNITIKNGKLRLSEPVKEKGMWLPINHFFRTLSKDKKEHAICIVFSGTGSDGTLGLKEVKGVGGMAMVQDPESAEYDGMPQSAIGTDMVDYILPPEQMPEQLISYISHSFTTDDISTEVMPDSWDEIFNLLYDRTGQDFSYYKRKTILRRIGRRMAVNSIEQLDKYVQYLKQNPLEVDNLFKELLITVTSFFRDPDAFEALREEAIVPLLKNINQDGLLRIWVPGCSTGEEAYSIAMLVQETMDYLQKRVNVQIFAQTSIKNLLIKLAKGSTLTASPAMSLKIDWTVSLTM